MRYFLDTEFNGFGGAMLSLALVSQDGNSLYLTETPETIEKLDRNGKMDPWVKKNILPILYAVPENIEAFIVPACLWGKAISDFIYTGASGRNPPQIIADWPSDIADFCKLLMTGPGTAVPMESQTNFTILRHIDVYPTTLAGAVQHNAWWDAMALREYVRLSKKK